MRKIEVDLGVIQQNYSALKRAFAPANVMAVVKANAYGHGMVEVARALEEVSVDAIGVADLDEALTLRAAGVRSRILCWILGSGCDFEAAFEQNIELGVSTFDQLEHAKPGTKLHIKIDTGLGRNGFSELDWEKLFTRIAGNGDVIGIFSHLSNTSVAEDEKQLTKFQAAIALASSHGIEFAERHLAASAGAVSYPDFRFEMVRCGIAVYGLNPFEDREHGLDIRPAMRVSAELVNVKRVSKGQGVSYGYRYVTERDTNLGLVPFGYGEGMPRVSTGHKVAIAGKLYPVVGRVAMDQFVVDLGDDQLPIGTEVIIFGDPARGEMGAEALGESAGSINYEIVTRIGGRAGRVFKR